MKPAVFLDRDGTVIENVHYLADPNLVRLIPGAAEAIREFQSLGYACVIITNQSAVGRGILTLEVLEQIHQEMYRQLALENATLDGLYFCPIAPNVADRTTIEHPDRKPGPGMLLRAARELDLDLANSWMIGDMLSDLHAGRNAGCRANILVRTGYGREIPETDPAIDYVAENILEAARIVGCNSLHLKTFRKSQENPVQ